MRVRTILGAALAALVTALSLTACAKTDTTPPAPPPTPATTSEAPANAPAAGTTGAAVQLNGAGATFPQPLYTKWFKDYSAAHPNVQVNYQGIGSGGGVKNFIAKTVDFGASDAAMSKDELAKVPGGAQLLPMTAGAIVLAYNLQGVTSLNLPRAVYSGIFLGKIKTWNDPAIAKANPGVNLPNTPINVIVRADGSGTTYVFTKHLSAISPEFAKNPGTNKLPNWSATFTKSKGNDGVAASIQSTPGAIGYVEYGYAKNNNMAMASLENKAGKLVAPTPESAKAALAAVKLPADMIAWVSDPEGAGVYPVVTYTWVMVYKKYADANKLNALKDVLTYALTEGQKSADALGYIALPDNVVAADKAALNAIL